MTWRSLTTVVSALAPTIGAAAHGPLAGSAVEAIAEALGITLEGDELERHKDQVAKAFVGSPKQLTAIKEAELQFGKQMNALGFNNAEALAKLVNEDETAREHKDWTPRVLALWVTAGFFALMAYTVYAEIPESSRALVNYLTGSLATAWVGIITYYFGSSANSDRKTDLLARRTNTNA